MIGQETSGGSVADRVVSARPAENRHRNGQSRVFQASPARHANEYAVAGVSPGWCFSGLVF